MLIDKIFFDDSLVGQGWHEPEFTAGNQVDSIAYRWMPSGKAISIETVSSNKNLVIRCSFLSVVDNRLLKIMKIKFGGYQCQFRLLPQSPEIIGRTIEVFVPKANEHKNSITFFVPAQIFSSNEDQRPLALAMYNVEVIEANDTDVSNFLYQGGVYS